MNDITGLTSIVMVLFLIISISVNIVFYLYSKKVLVRIYTASETTSEIFTILDAYREHLQSVYELPTFYFDSCAFALMQRSSR